MTSLRASLERVKLDLEELKCRWALVGALAVAARAQARATLDIDVAVAVDSPEAGQALAMALVQKKYRWKESFGTAMISLEVPGDAFSAMRLDLIFHLSGIESDVARDAENLAVLPGLEMPIARLGDLIALKLLAAREPEREHDHRDLRALVAHASAEDLLRARSSIELLVARNMASAGELEATLAALVQRRMTRDESA